MKRLTNEQREAVVRTAFAKRDELLADCAGGMPCTDCTSKKTCGKNGCVRQPEYVSHGAAQHLDVAIDAQILATKGAT
jgi:hypothetical protein